MKRSALFLLGREDVSVRFLAVLVSGTRESYTIAVQELY